MLYTIYRQDIDVDHLATEDVKEALQAVGELIDAGTADAYQVYMWHDADLAEYWDTSNKFAADPDDNYSLETFVRCFGMEQDEIPSAEIYRNLTEAEQIEAIHFMPDEMLIDELARRFHEYRRTTDQVFCIMDKMKIYV